MRKLKEFLQSRVSRYRHALKETSESHRRSSLDLPSNGTATTTRASHMILTFFLEMQIYCLRTPSQRLKPPNDSFQLRMPLGRSISILVSPKLELLRRPWRRAQSLSKKEASLASRA